jgi:hypothetical protein
MIRKKSISYLLLLCFSIFLGHNLIPHHHHSESLINGTADPCPIEHADQHEPIEHPFHCHAFNELAFFKMDPSVSKVEERLVIDLTFCEAESTGQLLTVQTGNACAPITTEGPNAGWRGSISLRGPPLTA